MSYYKILDHGFVGYIDHLGSDELIEQFARVSYGRGTRKKNDTENLIRYLMEHRHTSPFESCEIVFHIAIPIVTFRQMVRHRTASMNEYSARYSEVRDVWYIPSYDRYVTQSKTNKQGSSDEHAITKEEYEEYVETQNSFNRAQFNLYQDLLSKGVARETARNHLPLSTYTVLFWKCDLHNLFHFLKLRADDHAQWEIRQYAYLIGSIVKQLYPLTFKAWYDLVYKSESFNEKEINFLTKPDNFELTEKELKKFENKINKNYYDFSWDLTPTNPEELILCAK